MASPPKFGSAFCKASPSCRSVSLFVPFAKYIMIVYRNSSPVFLFARSRSSPRIPGSLSASSSQKIYSELLNS